MPDIRQPDLFDPERLARENAKLRAELGMTRAATKAERVSDGWNARALEALRVFAQSHQRFMAEDAIRTCPVAEGADPRAFGAIITQAKRLGWIRADGYAPANTSNRSPKCVWVSQIYRESKEAS